MTLTSRPTHQLLTALCCCLLTLLQTTARAADSIPLEHFATLPNMQQVALSPNGKFIAYLRPTKKGRQSVVIQSLNEKRKPVMLPYGEDSYVKWFHWLNDERIAVSYAFSKTVRRYGTLFLLGGGNLEQSRLLAFRRDGSDLKKPVQLIRGDGTGCSSLATRGRKVCPPPLIQDNVVDWLENDPKHILVAVQANLNRGWDVRRVNVANGRFTLERSGEDGIHNWLTDQQHEVRFGVGSNDKNEIIGVLKSPNGEWRDVSDTPWMQAEVFPYEFEADPRYAIAVGPANGETRSIVRLDLVEHKIIEVLHEHPDFDVFPLFDQGQLIGYQIPALEQAQVMTDPKWASLYQSLRKAIPNYQLNIIDSTPDEQLILVNASNVQDAGTVMAWDRANQQMYPLGTSYPDLEPDAMAPMEPITYKARDGLQITGYLSRPIESQVDKHLPVVIMPHGGPVARDTLGFDFMVQMLTSRGYAVLQPNFRGSLYQGRSFELAGRGQWGQKMQDDLTDGVDWLVEQGIADPDRICIVGWSYGGYAAFMGAIRAPDRFQCAASINGVADLKRYRGRYAYDRAWRRLMDDWFTPEKRELTEISPVHQAGRIGVPILIVHAKDDGRVPYAHGESMAEALRKNDKEVSFISIETGDHSLLDGQSRLTMLEALETFLAEHLKR